MLECGRFHLFFACSVQVLFTGEKIGVGLGKTRKDAQQQAAENALHNLAGKTASSFLFHSIFFLLILH